MDFTLTPEIEDLRVRTRAFVEEHVLPLEADPANFSEHENIPLERLAPVQWSGVVLALLFTSTALVPSHQMPAWLETLAQWNPLSLVANGLREALLLGQMPHAANLLPLLASGAFLFALASRTIGTD